MNSDDKANRWIILRQRTVRDPSHVKDESGRQTDGGGAGELVGHYATDEELLEFIQQLPDLASGDEA